MLLLWTIPVALHLTSQLNADWSAGGPTPFVVYSVGASHLPYVRDGASEPETARTRVAVGATIAFLTLFIPQE